MLRLLLTASLLAAAYGGLVPGRLPPVNAKVVGGQEVQIEDVPYQAALLYKNRFFCGGIILSETLVLTAAHCLLSDDANDFKISVGTNKLYKPGDSQAQVVNVDKFVFHPEESEDTFKYDAALLFLSPPLKLGPTASPVALPSQDQEIADGTPAVTSGWGRLKKGDFALSGLLQKVTVPIVNQQLCASTYHGLENVTSAMICAGLLEEGGRDACRGDSGGPLVAEGTLVGVVSWGLGCARPEYPGVTLESRPSVTGSNNTYN